ncbi:MAG: TonB-dependent receptor, partial [Acidobacteria bacterium]|nr:TonB-dependent receptor [Candidatus Polarisedimenticola svalbardensis]
MRPTRILLWVLLATMLGTGAVFAQTTGQVFGYVQDESGDGIAGATVVATSASLIGERGTTTNGKGKFILPLLPTGEYTIKVSMDGYQAIQLTEVTVMLGRSVTANAVLNKGELLETVVVTSEFPMIESKSADTTVNFNAKQLDTMPTSARSFRDLAKFVPSITSVDVNTSTGQGAGFPSIRGEGQYGDNYLIDGLTVRDPAVKTTGTPLPFDSIDEVQIITDGFSPEFGQALGGTINVITRSGSNEFGGSVAYLYKGDDTTADFRNTLFANPSAYEDTDPYVNFGGPVVKDKLWFFASYNRNESLDTFQETEILDSAGLVALVLPEGITDYENDTYFGKLTWAINPKNTLSGNYTMREAATSGLGASTSTVEARSGNDIEDTRWRVNYQSIFSANSVLEVKAGNVDRQSLTTPDNNLTDAQYRITGLDVNTNNAWRLNETN